MDVIVLIFLAIQLGKLAERKGQSSVKWRVYFVIGWLVGELGGAFLGMAIFGTDNTVSWVLTGIGGALAAYFIVKNHLTKLPDTFLDDDINNIGK